MAVKPQKTRRKPLPVPFHRVRVGQQCKIDGQLYHKFAVKKAMSESGQVRSVPDAALVVPV